MLIIIIIGILITVFYSVRFITLAISRVSISDSIFFKNDLGLYVNIRIIVLILPAISAGSVIIQKLNFSCVLLLIPDWVKIVAIFLLLIRVVLFYVYNKTISFFFIPKILWSIRRLWGVPFFSTRLPISSIKNLGDYSNKFSDFS